MIGRICLVTVFLCGLAAAGSGQALRLDDLPPTTGNTRFFQDQFAVRYPGLSLNGFTCADHAPEGCSHGLGLAEVLHAVYADAPVTSIKAVYEKLLLSANEPLVAAPENRGQVIENAQRIQARALVALVTYILERNGNSLRALNARTGPNVPSHRVALRRFKEAIAEASAFQVNRAMSSDAVKWTVVVTSMARSVDFYLALENAYQHYSDPDYTDEEADRLLSCTEKGQWLFNVAESVRRLNELGNEELIPTLNLDEVQPGNWPMKVHVAVGYAVLAAQVHDGRCYAAPEQDNVGWFHRALRSAGAPTNRNRSKHWNYQTGSGRRFFAEGPYYFHFALREIIPFWHAVRLNGLLDAHPDFDLDDPFRASWFFRPLHWLADLATPDGRVPALDDGNKVPLRDAALMRWTPAYGDAALGRKMAWVADQQDRGWGPSTVLLPVELAIPRLEAGTGLPPPDIGNTAADQTGGEGEQQLVIRRAAGFGSEGATPTHYVLLNGESGDAIRRGEGHEQGDQMQLLYYVDDVSYLLDSGYDDAAGLTNSTWNHYADHNVMTMGLDQGNGEGGVKVPRVRLDRRRVVSNHQDMRVLYRATTGRIDVLNAQIELHPDDDLDRGPAGDYRRTVLFIQDAHAPYLIDINAIAGPDDPLFEYVMRYHGNSDALSRVPERDGFAFWQHLWATTPEPVRTGSHLFLQPFSVEYPLKTTVEDDRVRETLNGERPIMRLDIEGGPPGLSQARNHTTVAFIRALPHAAGSGAVTSRPVEARTHRGGGVAEDTLLAWRYYTWQHDLSMIDVLAVRSAAVHREPHLRADEVLEVNTPDEVLALIIPADADYGFARLRRIDGDWRIDPAYHLNLEEQAGQPVAVEEPPVSVFFSLEPNVPNPFSTTTDLRFSLPMAAHTTLVVFDINGREVARLVDAWREAGRHRVAWDASRLASGVYFCRLSAADLVETRRMVLRK
ncbi:MAG: T9SS type A sorting domain-containing protein [Rhodothermales bacterium]